MKPFDEFSSIREHGKNRKRRKGDIERNNTTELDKSAKEDR